MTEPKKRAGSRKRVAILVDTSTTWGREVIAGVHRYSQENIGWQLFVEPRGLEQRQWLRSLPKPLAVFTWNSSSARELVYACMQTDLAVPEQVAVLSGSDDDLFCVVTPVQISASRI